MTRDPGPLSDVRVIELGQLIAGPFCGQILADFGADVVKVEQPGVGDPMRRWGEIREGRSLTWGVIARGKRLVTADLRTDDGRAFLLELAAGADVVIENFRPGTLERYGLGWDRLSAVNPRLILTRVSGFGQDGPYASRPGYGSIGEAMGGLRYLVGDPDRPPSRFGVSLGDELAGVHAAIGTLMALRARDKDGAGQVVDVSIYESVLAMTEALVSEFAIAGATRERSGAILPGVAPSNVYRTRDGQLLVIAANQDTVFRRLTAAMGLPELADDEKYATHQARGRHQRELDALVSAWTESASTESVLAALDDNAVPVGRIYTGAEMIADPQFQARESITRVEDPVLGSVPMQNVTPRLSRTPGRIRWSGGDLGQDDEKVRSELRDRADVTGIESD